MMDELLKHFGGQAALAKALNVTRGAVCQWVTSGSIPAFRAIEIEQLTRGEFKAVDLVVGGDKWAL